MFNRVRQVGRDIKQGFNTGVETQDELADIKFGKNTPGKQKKKRYSHSVIPGLAGGYYDSLSQKGVTARTPAQMAGALGARLLTDLNDDASRHTYWRYNHPQAIADVLAEQVIGDNIYNYNSAQRAAIELAGVGIPVAATLGVADYTNLGELGRAKGFQQNYSALGSEDRRETSNPVGEVIDRFALGRRGKPLKFATAQEDIPDLTKERYANYMNMLYSDKTSGIAPGAVIAGAGTAAALLAGKSKLKTVIGGGSLAAGAGALLGSTGALKYTSENLEGKPEALVGGFPVGFEAVGALLGGATAIRGGLLRDVGEERVPGGIGPFQQKVGNVNDMSQNIPGPMPKDKTVYREGQRKVKRNAGSAGRTGERVDKYRPRARTVVALGAAGALGGVLAGKFVNTMIASAGQSDLPTTQEYGVTPPMV
jgi:hypothetical protein